MTLQIQRARLFTTVHWVYWTRCILKHEPPLCCWTGTKMHLDAPLVGNHSPRPIPHQIVCCRKIWQSEAGSSSQECWGKVQKLLGELTMAQWALLGDGNSTCLTLFTLPRTLQPPNSYGACSALLSLLRISNLWEPASEKWSLVMRNWWVPRSEDWRRNQP